MKLQKYFVQTILNSILKFQEHPIILAWFTGLVPGDLHLDLHIFSISDEVQHYAFAYWRDLVMALISSLILTLSWDMVLGLLAYKLSLR